MKKLLALAICILLFVTIASCGETAINNKSVNTDFIKLDDSDLCYDKNTLIVYMKSAVQGGVVYTPYYSENGKLYVYDTGTIVEVDEDNKNYELNEDYYEITKQLAEINNKLNELNTNKTDDSSSENTEEPDKNKTDDSSSENTEEPDKNKSAASICWNTDLKSVFAENYVKAHAEDIDKAYCVTVYYDIDEEHHACGSMVYGKSDTYSKHEFDSENCCKYCGYIREEDRDN